jgi:hypothetical protein
VETTSQFKTNGNTKTNSSVRQMLNQHYDEQTGHKANVLGSPTIAPAVLRDALEVREFVNAVQNFLG